MKNPTDIILLLFWSNRDELYRDFFKKNISMNYACKSNYVTGIKKYFVVGCPKIRIKYCR